MSAKKTRSLFSESNDILIMDHLLEAKAAGNMSDNGFKMTVWEALAEKLSNSDSSGLQRTANSCKD